MRHGRALLLGLLTVWVMGCASDKPSQAVAWFERWRPFQGPTGADVVQMDVAVLQRPINDPFINQELWVLADEQTVPLERKAILEENGFRVGQIGGLTPARLQAMLTSEQSCVDPRRLYLHAGNPTTLTLGPQARSCRFRIAPSGQAEPITLEQAVCTLSVVPTLTRDGRLRLQFTPQVRHGEANRSPWAADDRSGWVLQSDRPSEAYPALAWEVTLAPNQYVIVGARAERSESLGYQYFLRWDEPVPVQRLLVIRACPAGAPPADDLLEPGEDAGRGERTAPLALQAGWITARGSSR
jgi:hypothetical protein